MRFSHKQESGFTLIELLVSIGIIGILSATSIQAFHEYRTSVQHKMIDAMIPTVKTAIEAGYTEQDRLDSSYWIETANPGPVSVSGADEIVPGLTNNNDTHLIIYAAPWCEEQPGDWCLVEYVRVHSCKDNYVHAYYRYNQGVVSDYTFYSGSSCP